MSLADVTIREVLLVEAFEREKEILEKRIAELEAILQDPDYKGAIARRYAFHVLNKANDESLTYDQYKDYLIKLFRGAVTEALEAYEANSRATKSD